MEILSVLAVILAGFAIFAGIILLISNFRHPEINDKVDTLYTKVGKKVRMSDNLNHRKTQAS